MFWPDEVESNKVIYTHRFELDPIKIVKNDSELLPWIDGLPFTKGLNHIAKQIHLKKLLEFTNKHWNVKLQHRFDFPFEVNGFYNKDQIWKILKLSPYGGIRINKDQNFIVLFSNASTSKSPKDKFRNIYKDRFDETTGVYYYTGEGQEGDQSITKGNLALVQAKKGNRDIYFFKQYEKNHDHEFLGKVQVLDKHIEIQNDSQGKQRQVIVFHLKLLSSPETSEQDAENREIDFEQSNIRKTTKTKKELEERLEFLSNKIEKEGPKMVKVTTKQTNEQAKRHKEIVATMKEIYSKECQVCGTKHFEKNNGVYSEVHHLIPWSQSYDDSKSNLVVICANCHRKFDHAKNEIKKQLFQQLQKRYPNITYKTPSYVK